MSIIDVAARTSRSKRGRPRDEQVSSAIEQAALRQLDELGYAQLSMESIALEAGVSRATIYRRYKDKADLITATIAANIGGRFPTAPSMHPREDLVAYLEQFDKRFGQGCLEIIGTLVATHEQSDGLALHRQRIVEPRTAYARGLLVRAQELGQLDAELDVELAVEMLAGSVFARRVHGTKSATDWAERAVAMIWRP